MVSKKSSMVTPQNNYIEFSNRNTKIFPYPVTNNGEEEIDRINMESHEISPEFTDTKINILNNDLDESSHDSCTINDDVNNINNYQKIDSICYVSTIIILVFEAIYWYCNQLDDGSLKSAIKDSVSLHFSLHKFISCVGFGFAIYNFPQIIYDSILSYLLKIKSTPYLFERALQSLSYLIYSISTISIYLVEIDSFNVYTLSTRIYMTTSGFMFIRVVKNSKFIFGIDYFLLSINFIIGSIALIIYPICKIYNITMIIPIIFTIAHVIGNLIIDIKYISNVSFSEIYEKKWEEIVVYVMIIINIFNMTFLIAIRYIFRSSAYNNASQTVLCTVSIYLLLMFWLTNFVFWMYSSIKTSLSNWEIADQKEEIADQNSKLDSQEQELQFQKKIIAIISHECRNPLTILVFIFDGLLADIDDYTKSDIIDNCYEGKKACNCLLTSLNDFKNDAGKNNLEHKIQVKPKINDLLYVLQEIVSQQLMVFKEDNKLLKLTIEKKKPYKVRVDYDQLFRAFIKLLDNSRKFIPKDGHGLVEITIKEENYYYIAVVQDNGIGIKDSIKDKIFDEGFTDDQGTGNKGSGIGLNEFYSIIKNHGGSVSIDSKVELPSYTKFYVSIPIAFDLKPEEEIIYSKIFSKNATSFSPIISEKKSGKRTILVVDDAPLIRKCMKSILEKFNNIDVHTAENGKVAVDNNKNNNYDMIFMDYEMPVMSGRDACIEIRKVKNEIIIIGITGNVLDEQKTLFLSSGATEVYEKPVNKGIIKEILIKYKLI